MLLFFFNKSEGMPGASWRGRPAAGLIPRKACFAAPPGVRLQGSTAAWMLATLPTETAINEP